MPILPHTSTLLYAALKPLLFRLDAERAHGIVSGLLAGAGRSPAVLAALHRVYACDDPALRVACAGLHFANPLGMAAGFDKRAALIGPLGALGFSHVEVGTVTPRPQPGNPRPRMFRLPHDRALINRLGFNSPGMVDVTGRLRAQLAVGGMQASPISHLPSPVPHPPSPVIGVNIGKNRATPLERAPEDYAAAFVALAPFADYVTINISSPNTPGLRLLHERDALQTLLGTVAAANRRMPVPRPLFLKVSPDETAAQLDEVIAVALDAGVAGFIATNTTLDRTHLRSAAQHETGGLSGAPLAARARAVIAHLHAATGGSVPIIGVGGVSNAADAYAHIAAGATLVQLYTGMVYGGPAIAHTINRGLVALLRQHGHATIGAAVGSAAR